MKYDDEIWAGWETDTFIHLRVFERSDEAPPYSTDQKTAEWLAEHYCFTVKPMHVLSRRAPIDALTEEDLGEPRGYVVIAKLEIIQADGESSTDTYIMSSAPTYPLCVARSALLLNNLVLTSWATYDPADDLPPGFAQLTRRDRG